MKVAQEDPNGPITLLLSNTQLLQSLADSIPDAQSFRGKWGLIQTKLTTHEIHLFELSSSTAIANSGISTELLRSVSAALSDALCISIHCQSSTPHGGKLKTQNDIDSVSAKLDNLNSDLEVLNRSGVLNENRAVSSTASKRETVRAESRNLITRLQIGTAESKNSALDSLLGLLYEEDKNVLIAVAQGIVPVLVSVLDSTSSSEVKEKTVTAIAKISTVDSSKRVLIAEGLGLLHNLLRVVESGSIIAKESSCIALQTLSQSKENARVIGSRGGISSLLEICETGTPHCQAMAASVLKNLAIFTEIKDHFVEENAAMILLGLSNSGTTLAQENAIGCLSNLIAEDDNLKLLVAKEGGIESLQNFWDSAPSIHSLESPIQMLIALSSCPLIADAIMEAGFPSRIISLFRYGVLGVRIAAARALCEMGYTSRTRKRLGEMGCIPPLVAMLEAKAAVENDAAARALSKLLICAGNRRIFKKEERGIVSLVQLLDPVTHQNVDKRHPLSILSLLAHSKEWRKKMAAAGASAHLRKLAEMNVDGAKKLLDCLGRSKLWVVFSRP